MEGSVMLEKMYLTLVLRNSERDAGNGAGQSKKVSERERD